MNKKVITIFRKTHKLTQKELGELIGLAGQTISAYEVGRFPIPRHIKKRLERLIDEYGIDRTEDVIDGYRVTAGKKVVEEPVQIVEEVAVTQEDSRPTEEDLSNSYHIANEGPRPIEELPAVLEELFGKNEPELIQGDFVPINNEVRPDSEHYHTGTIDVWKFAEENFSDEEILGFHRINAIKYITRFGKKGGKNLKDLEKATASVQKIIQLEGAKI